MNLKDHIVRDIRFIIHFLSGMIHFYLLPFQLFNHVRFAVLTMFSTIVRRGSRDVHAIANAKEVHVL